MTQGDLTALIVDGIISVATTYGGRVLKARTLFRAIVIPQALTQGDSDARRSSNHRGS